MKRKPYKATTKILLSTKAVINFTKNLQGKEVVNVVKRKKPLQDKWQVFAKHKKPYKAKPHKAKWQAQILLKAPQGKVVSKSYQPQSPARQNKASQSFFKRIQALKFLFLRVF